MNGNRRFDRVVTFVQFESGVFSRIAGHKRESDHMRVLLRRADHLANRIANSPGRDLTFDKRELSALLWALDLVADLVPTGLTEKR